MTYRVIILFLLMALRLPSFAGNGDSIFNMQYIHTLHITFPYPAFYDSLVNTHGMGISIPVEIDFNGEVYHNVGITAKGNSSFNNPSQKKSFKLDFNEYVAGQDIHGLKKLNFNNFFKDPSFMREKLVNDFLTAHQLPAPRVTYCNVYMNGQLWGLYGIVEEIDDEFCDHWFSNQDGNLFKGDPHGDLRWKGTATQSLYEPDYELKNNSTANNWTDLIALIDAINNTPSASLYSVLETKLNTNNFIRQWVVMNVFSSLDSYIGSGHNYYIYHDTITDRFEWVAWDNNETFGGFKMGLTSAQLKNLDLFYLSTPASRPLVNNMLNNTTYKKLYQQAYCELKQDVSNTKLNPIIDSLRSKIQASVYADPKKFYSNNMFDSSFNYDVVISGPGGMTVFGLKNFIAARRMAIDSMFNAKGIPCWPNGLDELNNAPTISVYPNPFGDAFTIRSGQAIRELAIRDLSGRLLLKQDPNKVHEVQINTAAWPSQVYLLQINGEKPIRLVK